MNSEENLAKLMMNFENRLSAKKYCDFLVPSVVIFSSFVKTLRWIWLYSSALELHGLINYFFGYYSTEYFSLRLLDLYGSSPAASPLISLFDCYG